MIAGLMLGIFFYLASCGGGKTEQEDRGGVDPDTVRTVTGYGRISSLSEILEIAPEVAGVVNEVMVEEGDTLSPGDTIFVINHKDILAGIRSLQSEIEASGAAIQATASSIETGSATLESRETYLERLRKSHNEGSVSSQQLDEAELNLDQASGRLEELQLRKERQEHELESALQKLRQEEIRLSAHFIRAADSGMVLSLDVEKSKPLRALQAVGQFRVLGPYAIEGEIDELYAARIARGQTVKAVPYGRSDTIACGTVVRVSPRLSEKSLFSDNNGGFMDRRVRSFEARIDSARGKILIGQRVNVYMDLGQ